MNYNNKRPIRQPVSYQDPKREAITCYFQLYREAEGRQGVFESTASLREVCFTDIITHTNLVIEEDGALTIPEEELVEIERATTSLLQPHSNQPRARGTSQRHLSQFASDSGITRTVTSMP